ncbi:unnamed protein product [Amoebophrya sp. A25]|nr:unnamed protein product [Amoebophrya sp. A25]|eukprot:GSA25T00017287001.1
MHLLISERIKRLLEYPECYVVKVQSQLKKKKRQAASGNTDKQEVLNASGNNKAGLAKSSTSFLNLNVGTDGGHQVGQGGTKHAKTSRTSAKPTSSSTSEAVVGEKRQSEKKNADNLNSSGLLNDSTALLDTTVDHGTVDAGTTAQGQGVSSAVEDDTNLCIASI